MLYQLGEPVHTGEIAETAPGKNVTVHLPQPPEGRQHREVTPKSANIIQSYKKLVRKYVTRNLDGTPLPTKHPA